MDIKYNEVNMKVLRDQFKAFVSQTNPHISYISACNWAFYPLKHDIGINFWDIFRGNNLELCENLLYKHAVTKGTVKDPKGDTACYMRSLYWLKQYFDSTYGGVDNYLSGLG